MASTPSPLDRFLSRLLKNDPPRAKSLCVSLLGDALAPHGGAIWLGDLIELLAPIGINERLLRTSVFRLVAQGWLQSERHGRRSLYLLSEHGLRHTAHASQRIYDGPARAWNGEWTLVALPRAGNNGLAERGELRRELLWEGFGMVAPGLFAHPQTEARAAHDILEKLGIPDKALVLSARDLAGAGGLPIASLAGQCWNLDEVADQYRLFSRNFGPVEKLLDPPPTPAQAFAVRVLLLHNWRRIVLHDPQLPTPMEPDGWPGNAARALCRRIYWQVFDASERHLDAVAGRENARYRPAQADIMGRFGGRP
ncbi:phenylacetic acid degradation operon negative regulatory protein PaaX [Bordetella bronchiseptica]|uniref:Phenylacetic acid degradation operon negative regulatory protein n=3 Tax=Bordetella bronchiseptica TaxID=518 RepID=A0A0H3LPK9_BORBR|nr:phenylacetic acid degradation operon negative regulatory protein PaaX [Bordetella bronchiseptica]KAK61698.1 phenylacetic acid degradation operon negative regulatory protein PaaX [Bordetella bronchiseptica 980-2]KCV31347.1 phenylacetic acid degradation operon negative regulatory protein PaaX [Bordetella bronchiseptica 00-P-2730]KDD60214.1 phenylacetic acid degradation operon negative regulatory protein PaaX [Bordetella bronchiseptica OSU553]SHS94677.1 putative regulatory protein [Mycobacteroi